jgi:hypothetical protein
VILRKAVERQALLIKTLKRRKRILIKKIIKLNINKHQDGRQLYELSIKELATLLNQVEVRISDK